MIPKNISTFPKVAAVIPTRNRIDKLLRFLEEFSCQTYPNLQIIIVDSNSTDCTREEVIKRFPQIILVKANDQAYWTGATNMGVKLAMSNDCEYVLTINDDSIVEPTYLERIVSIVQKYQITILGSCINYLSNPNLVWSLGTSNHWGTDNFLRLNYHNIEISNLLESIKMADIIQVDALPGNGVLIHRKVFEEIGLYNETFLPHYHADSELTIRATNANIKVFVSPLIILLNDFESDQKKLNLKQSSGLIYALFHKKSHLFIVPLIYIFLRYCPNYQKVSTLRALINRFIRLRVNKPI